MRKSHKNLCICMMLLLILVILASGCKKNKKVANLREEEFLGTWKVSSALLNKEETSLDKIYKEYGITVNIGSEFTVEENRKAEVKTFGGSTTTKKWLIGGDTITFQSDAPDITDPIYIWEDGKLKTSYVSNKLDEFYSLTLYYERE